MTEDAENQDTEGLPNSLDLGPYPAVQATLLPDPRHLLTKEERNKEADVSLFQLRGFRSQGKWKFKSTSFIPSLSN